MQPRVAAILAELGQRHFAGPELLERLRPMVERILGPDLADDDRLRLLELLAETCERGVQLRADFASIRVGFDRMFARLAEIVREAGERGGASPNDC
jgi:hypothetical protein